MYYNHYAIEFAFKKAMNLDTIAVVHFAISACKWRGAEFSVEMSVAEHVKWKYRFILSGSRNWRLL